LQQCLRLDPDNRPTCSNLLKHSLFTRDGFASRYPIELKQKLQKEALANPLYKNLAASLDAMPDTQDTNKDSESTSKSSLTTLTSQNSQGGAAGGGTKKKAGTKKDSTKDTSFKRESTIVNKDGLRKVSLYCPL
jgi:serine/threonine protein kinase